MTKSTWALVALALLGGFYVLFQIATRTPEPPAHQVFIGGAVLTMNAEQPIAEAVSGYRYMMKRGAAMVQENTTVHGYCR